MANSATPGLGAGTPLQKITFATTTKNAATGNVSYRLVATFSSVGVFANALYNAKLTCNNANVIISENLNPKTTGAVGFTVYVPSTEVGSSGVDIIFTLELEGSGWTGASVDALVATWSSFTQV